MIKAAKSTAVQGRGRPPQSSRGRPCLGSYRLETMLPQACLDELIRREESNGLYRTGVAALILIKELTGQIPQHGNAQRPQP